MQIITEINYDWLWWVGLIIIIVSIVFFAMFVEKYCDWAGVVGLFLLFLGIILFIFGLIQLKKPHSFRIRLDNSYTIGELISQCDSVKYEPKYDTWLVRFKEEDK